MLYDIKILPNEKKTKMAVFIDMDSMDKVETILSPEEFGDLASHKGKKGVLSVSLTKKGYDYSVSFMAFKASA